MDFIEFLSRLDYYQQSVKIYTNSLIDNYNMNLDQTSPSLESSPEISLTPYSNASGTIPLRARSKRSMGMKTKLKMNQLAKQPIVFSNEVNNTVEEEMDNLLEQLKKPYSDKPLQRPYIPIRVWHGTNWEDWAQFQIGDIIHVPFNEIEDKVLLQKVTEVIKKNPKYANTVFSDGDIWSELPLFLPGRDIQDCQFRYMDIDESKSDKVFGKTFIVSKDYGKVYSLK